MIGVRLTSGTQFTVPAGITTLTVYAIGAGGNGGTGGYSTIRNQSWAGGGGGAGACAVGVLTVVPNSVITYQIGQVSNTPSVSVTWFNGSALVAGNVVAAGATSAAPNDANAGAAGAASNSFGSQATYSGGAGGAGTSVTGSNTSCFGGGGGGAATFNNPGNNGGLGNGTQAGGNSGADLAGGVTPSGNGYSGAEFPAPTSGAGSGGAGGNASTSPAGGNAGNYGGGGGGAGHIVGGGAQTAGLGTQGVIVVTYASIYDESIGDSFSLFSDTASPQVQITQFISSAFTGISDTLIGAAEVRTLVYDDFSGVFSSPVVQVESVQNIDDIFSGISDAASGVRAIPESIGSEFFGISDAMAPLVQFNPDTNDNFSGFSDALVPQAQITAPVNDNFLPVLSAVSSLFPIPKPASQAIEFLSTFQSETIPAYLYVQYNDDDNLNAFVQSYNGMTQQYVQWFSSVNIANYTTLSGLLLDWIGNGLYGFTRPVFAAPGNATIGPLDTMMANALTINAGNPGTASTYMLANDDIYQRCLTWNLYKGDGKYFTIPWLKNRVLRFLYGANGTDINTGNTSTVSVSIAGTAVTINIHSAVGVPADVSNAFQYAIQGNILELPPTFSWHVTL